MVTSTSPLEAGAAELAGPFGPCDLVTRGDIRAYLKLTPTQMCRLARHACFPEPVLWLGPKSPRWRLGDVLAWMAAGGCTEVDAELAEPDGPCDLFSAGPRKRGPKAQKVRS